jgi:pantoate--beta-alanine ligase
VRVFDSIPALKDHLHGVKSIGKRLGFVPTMGFLHEGHLSLVRASLERSDHTVVSIFVNPAQFAPHEDFADYPRDMGRDLELLEREGVDTVFAPPGDALYQEGYATYVEVHELQDRLCGRSRPVFFRGVCTIVLKLLHIVSPHVAFFGQKDAQQAIIIRRMVKELDLDVEIEVCPIVRDHDGLALSSRNSYFDPEQRRAALCLFRGLSRARTRIDAGERNAERLKQEIRAVIEAESKARIDYVEIVDTLFLLPKSVVEPGDLIAAAVYIDRIRLIDNIIV